MAPLSNYYLPSPDSSSPLVNPSHASLHQSTNTAIGDIDRRVASIEDAVPATAANIEQARLVSHTAMVRGLVPVALDGTLLVPILYNLSARAVSYVAAVANLMVAADQDFVVDIVNGTTMDDNTYNPDMQSSILKNGPLVIPAGQHTSPFLETADDFVGAQATNTYVAFVIRGMGTEDMPGGNLTVQLNRLL